MRFKYPGSKCKFNVSSKQMYTNFYRNQEISKALFCIKEINIDRTFSYPDNLCTVFVSGNVCTPHVSRKPTYFLRFQENNVRAMHLLGAFLAFVVGFIYFLLQTIISFQTAPADDIPGNTPMMRCLRVLLLIIDSVFLLLCILIYYLRVCVRCLS